MQNIICHHYHIYFNKRNTRKWITRHILVPLNLRLFKDLIKSSPNLAIIFYVKYTSVSNFTKMSTWAHIQRNWSKLSMLRHLRKFWGNNVNKKQRTNDNYPSRACGLAPTACFGVVPSKGLKTEKHKTN